MSTYHRSQPVISVVIPVYNSESVVGDTIDQTLATCRSLDVDFEILLVNDGSPDGSWDVISEAARRDPSVKAIDLLRNYGQHTAVFVGLRHARGEYVITIDDDLQNPPSEIPKLLDKARQGYDLVLGRFEQKQHSLFRRLGSRIVGWMNRKVFHKPKDLVLTNFRCIRRDVVSRMTAYQTSYPYIPGLALMFSHQRANVTVEHHPATRRSGYTLRKILGLVARILFNYSSFPLRLVSRLGLLITAVAFALTGFIVIRAAVIGVSVPGWTSVALMLSFFNGVTLLIISMLGEYVVRLLDQSSHPDGYHIRATVGVDA
jgi:glycosyltransferase involved in cell wall biosynthesis